MYTAIRRTHTLSNHQANTSPLPSTNWPGRTAMSISMPTQSITVLTSGSIFAEQCPRQQRLCALPGRFPFVMEMSHPGFRKTRRHCVNLDSFLFQLLSERDRVRVDGCFGSTIPYVLELEMRSVTSFQRVGSQFAGHVENDGLWGGS